MNLITGLLLAGIAFALAVRTFFVKAIFNIELPAHLSKHPPAPTTD